MEETEAYAMLLILFLWFALIIWFLVFSILVLKRLRKIHHELKKK